IKNVILLGATGNLGTEILNALINSGQFTVTIAQRASSSSRPGPKAPSDKFITVNIDDDLSLDSLKAAFRGQHAVIVATRPGDGQSQLRIADAAAATPGMRRVIPADYGSCDSTTARAQELVPIFKRKAEVRARLQSLAEASSSSSSSSSFSWTSIVCGHFFDWGLRENFLHFNLRTRTADILGDGTMRSSTSTLARVAEAVVRVLSPEHEARTRNMIVYVQSFCVSQLDVLRALERATSGGGGGGKEWQAKYIDAEEFIAENKARVEKGETEANEDLVFALGAIDGDWTTREGFAMEMLGLEDEDLDEVVGRVV
ncbi:uncharacterized protein B0I36DRAFT_222653, partial [Microdochium trichocladiopsis]